MAQKLPSFTKQRERDVLWVLVHMYLIPLALSFFGFKKADVVFLTTFHNNYNAILILKIDCFIPVR